MKKAFKIARFEFVEKARTKAYLLFMVMFPVIIGAVSIVPAILVQNNNESHVIIGVLDCTNSIGNEFIRKIEECRLNSGKQKYIVVTLNKPGISSDSLQKEADNLIYKGYMSGYILLEKEQSSIKASFRQSHFLAFNELYQIEKVLNQSFTLQKLQQIGYKNALADNIIQDIKLNTVQISGRHDSSSQYLQNALFPAVVSMLLLFTLILFSGGQMIRSVMEEKSNRIMEILLSSCTAKELLTGKVLGLGMLGLFQIFIWSLIAVLLLALGIIPEVMFSNIELISVYFVLGYLLYTSIFVGAGSVVTTELEAQHFTSYISLVMTLPLIISLKAVENPNLFFVRILSYFPLTSPPVMLLRLKILTPPLWEILLTITILILSVYAAIFLSSRIFRIGILSYGKRPTLKEIAGWIREK